MIYLYHRLQRAVGWWETAARNR